MTFQEVPTLLASAISLGVLALASALHFMWHPLRAYFSDALDFLRIHRLPFWICLFAVLLNAWTVPEGGGVRITWVEGDFSSMSQDARSLVQAGVQEALILLHQAFPPMPIALLLPVWIVQLVVEVMRYPFRYGSVAVRPEERLILMILCVLSITWAVVFFATHWLVRKEELEVGLNLAGFVFGALTLAGYQVWLACLVMEWARPRAGVSEESDSRTAKEEVFARWRNILWLGGFNAVWIGFIGWAREHDPLWSWGLLYEMLFLFASLPLAIAAVKADFLQVGGLAIRALWRCWLPMLGWTLTATVFLCLARYAAEVFRLNLETGPVAWLAVLIRSLLTAMLHTWLLATAMLVLYRSGFPKQDRGLT